MIESYSLEKIRLFKNPCAVSMPTPRMRLLLHFGHYQEALHGGSIFGSLPAHVVFIPLDLTRPSLEQALTTNGLRTYEPALFVCEGVIQYLVPNTVSGGFSHSSVRRPGEQAGLHTLHQEHCRAQIRHPRFRTFEKTMYHCSSGLTLLRRMHISGSSILSLSKTLVRMNTGEAPESCQTKVFYFTVERCAQAIVT